MICMCGAGMSGGGGRVGPDLGARDPRPGLPHPRLLQPPRHLLRVQGQNQRRVGIYYVLKIFGLF